MASRARAYGWRPNLIAGCQLWLRGDLGITTATGVSAWADQSGKGNHFTQATGANQPALVASNIGGQPGLRFNGTSHKMAGPTGSSIFSASSAWMYLVWRPISVTLNVASPVYANDSIVGDNGADYGLAVRGGGNGVSAYNYTGSYANTTLQPVSNGTAYVVAWKHSASVLACQLGQQTPQTAASGNTVFGAAMELGSCQGIRYANMDVCEIVAGNTAISAADEARLLKYMSGRYGVAL